MTCLPVPGRVTEGSGLGRHVCDLQARPSLHHHAATLESTARNEDLRR